MKIYALLSLTLLATQAFANPGKSSLVCTSQAGAKEAIKVEIARYTSKGTLAPTVQVTVNGKVYKAVTSINSNYGETIHAAALGNIFVTAANDRVSKGIQIYTGVMSIPGTVSAKYVNGEAASDKTQFGACTDSYGSANFQGVLDEEGIIIRESGKPDVIVAPQTLDCELTYDTGSAC